MLDSCTHIAGEFTDHEALRTNHYNAACQLVHAAIRETARGGGALHIAPDLVLVAAYAGSQSQTSDATLASLSSAPEGENTDPRVVATPLDWLASLPTMEDIHGTRHTDPMYNQRGLSTADGDVECTTAPCRVPEWVLS